jgi:DNA invertase Pin-like site-specific DNA recombinase
MDYLNGGAWELAGEFTEVESGKKSDRPEPTRAIEACRKHKARLVIAKLDRLSRNLAFVATLMDSGVEFVAVDNPHANKLTIHILAAVAEHEREAISERTKAALAAAKARGKPWSACGWLVRPKLPNLRPTCCQSFEMSRRRASCCKRARANRKIQQWNGRPSGWSGFCSPRPGTTP